MPKSKTKNDKKPDTISAQTEIKNNKKPFFKWKISLPKKVLIFSSAGLVLFLSVSLSVWLLLADRVFPGILIAGVNVSLLTKDQAQQKLTQSITKRTNTSLQFKNKQETYQVSLTQITLTAAIQQAVNQAFSIGHDSWYTNPTNISLNITPDELIQPIKKLESEVNEPPIDAQLKVEPGDQINVTPSQDGFGLDELNFTSQIETYLNTNKLPNPQIPLRTLSPQLTYQSATQIKQKLDQIKLSPLQLTFKDQTFPLTFATLLGLIDFNNSETFLASSQFNNSSVKIESIQIGNNQLSDAKLLLNPQKTAAYFKTIADQIDQEVQEPLFEFDPSNQSNSKIKEFKPPVEGQKLQIDKASQLLSESLVSLNQPTIELPVEIIKPKNKLSNELGIKELVARGSSNFAGSIENRIYNVALGAQKINGVLIPPGEVFSFNKTVGDISAATGFKQAYVIKSGRTVLDDGGGICQVSTTLFRSVLNAGLPIITRTAHAYRVGYYEQGYPPGLDATIFYPSVDFQFKNDTNSYLLIQTHVAGTSLTVDLYGTPDGRTVQLSKPSISSQTPAPPELRQDDPTLPKGTVKQVDFAAAGANVVFSRKVLKDGQPIINESFKSNYRPWQAIYLVGTKEG